MLIDIMRRGPITLNPVREEPPGRLTFALYYLEGVLCERYPKYTKLISTAAAKARLALKGRTLDETELTRDIEALEQLSAAASIIDDSFDPLLVLLIGVIHPGQDVPASQLSWSAVKLG